MPEQTLELLKAGANAHQQDKFRAGNLVTIPAGKDVIVTGDLHGNRRNFERIVNFADLDNNPDTHLVLQEIIHGGPEDEKGGCLSFQILFEAIKLKINHPDNVHILMGNHDTAFISHSEVMKNGKEMNQSMRDALERSFGVRASEIDLEIARTLFAQPLAIKCANRIMLAHSLPSDSAVDDFDIGIFDRNLKVNDIVRPQSAYLWTWGRRQSKKNVDKLAKILDVDMFIVGHQNQPEGFKRISDKLLIIASDHNHGMFVKFNTSDQMTMDQLVSCVTPLASLI